MKALSCWWLGLPYPIWLRGAILCRYLRGSQWSGDGCEDDAVFYMAVKKMVKSGGMGTVE